MFYKKCTKKLYSFLLSNTSLLSDKFSILKENKKVIITIDEKLTDEKLQYNINTEVITIALWSDKMGKGEYLPGKEILPFDQRVIILQTNLVYSLLGKMLGKQTIAEQGKKQDLIFETNIY